MNRASLSLAAGQTAPMVALGEVLWDVLPNGESLGGAPLNFAIHAHRLGHRVLPVSAVGWDDLGRRTLDAIRQSGLETGLVQTTGRWPTGLATVALDAHGQPTFTIQRPAAYDAVEITDAALAELQTLAPAWVYYGTLFASTHEGRATLTRLLDALPEARRFYDVNLRPGFDSPPLVLDLMARATVVKLNEVEVAAVGRMSGLPVRVEEFCRAGAERFGWSAVCVTLGPQGCAMLRDGEYQVAKGYAVEVADAVGAGDAFAAAFVHGLSSGWPTPRVADFANRLGATVASRIGATPIWNLAEVEGL